MEVLITYFSETGNTEKVARAIYDALRVEKELMPVRDVSDLNGYDLIFCGFPVHSHSVPMPVQNFIKKIPPGQKLALFSTHGSLRGGELAVTAMEYATSLAAQTKLLGIFGCRGKVVSRVIEALSKQPEHRAWAQMAKSATGHPDEADLEDAMAFARTVLTKAAA